MKIKMLFFIAIIGVIWMTGCSVHQTQTKQDAVLSGQGSIAESDDDKGNAISSSAELPNERTSDLPEEELLSMATDFAIYFPRSFSSAKELDPTRFTLFKLYENNPNNCDKEGVFWVTPEELSSEVSLRFDISDYHFISPEQENVYPQYVEDKKAIAFYPVGEGPRYVVELVNQEREGNYCYFTFGIYDNVITDEHKEKTLEQKLCYKFCVVENNDGVPFLQAISASEIE